MSGVAMPWLHTPGLSKVYLATPGSGSTLPPTSAALPKEDAVYL